MPNAKLPTPEQDVAYGQGAAEVRQSLRYSTYFFGNSQKSQMPFVVQIIAQRFAVEELGALSTACVLSLILSIVDWYRHGWSPHDAVVLGGAIASIVTSFLSVFYFVNALEPHNRSPSGLGVFTFTLMGFVPFFFALYLIAFESIYMAVERFSLGQLIQSTLFLFLGHWIAKRIRRLQEFQSCVYEQVSSVGSR